MKNNSNKKKRVAPSFKSSLKMKLTVLSLFTVLFGLHANDSYSQKTKVSLDIENASVREVIDAIESTTDFKFIYKTKYVDLHRKISLKAEQENIKAILDNLFYDTDTGYKVRGVHIVLRLKQKRKNPVPKKIAVEEPQDPVQVTGKITDGNGQPLPGTNVVEKGTINGTQSDFDGNYSLTVADENAVLIISYIGFATKEIAVNGQSTVNISLEESTAGLDEVVVTALGIKREKKALGYAAQELKGDELNSAREVSVANYLTGKVAGVQVSNPSSGIGGSTNVTIRGNSSLSGSNQPLYVVDGVPIINQSNSDSDNGIFGGNDYGDGIGNINPDDIESMTVLKGPSASALYGSRGANGVIVITTKSGRSQKGLGVEFNSTTTLQMINLIPRVQNKYGTGYEGTNLFGSLVEIDGAQYETMPAWHGDMWGPPLDGRRVVSDPFLLPGEEPRTLRLLPQDPNNVKDFYETGLVTNNMIALSGGTENTAARLSFGNTYTEGIIPNNSGARNTITLRVNSKLSDRLSFDAKINYTNTKFDNRPTLGAGADNVNSTLIRLGRYVPLDFLKKHYEITGERGRFPGVRVNPYYTINEITNNDERNRFIGFASLRYEFTDWLSLSARSGIDFYTDERQNIWPVGAAWPNTSGRFVETVLNSKESNTDFLLTAAGDLSGDFTGSFSVGGNLLKQYDSRMEWDARDLKVPGVYNISNAVDVRPSSFLREKEIQSLYALGQLAYKDYLFLDLTARNDWSSTLGRNNYSFFYPSAGLSFVFTDAFNMTSDFFTFGKLRASWAQVGNDSDPYLTRSGFNSFNTNYNGQGFASAPSQIPALDLRNELTESIELGFDIRLFNNRFGLDVTYYEGSTKDQILPVQISNSSGFQTRVINAGEIKNSGLEVVFNAGIVRSDNGFNWDLSFNYSNNRSEVVSLAPGIETFLLVDGLPNDIEARVGEAFGNIIGRKYRRSPDGRRIVTPGGNYTPEEENSILGNITPDWIGGLNNSFSYKGFFMNALVDFVQGGELSSLTKYEMLRRGSALFTEEGRRPVDTDDNGAQLPYVGVRDGVVEIFDAEGNVTGYEENTQAVDGQTYWAASSAWSGVGEEFVMDASYIMLREVIMGYNFNTSKIKNSPFTGVRVSLVGRNLFYIQENMQDLGISPESAPNTAPGARGIESYSIPSTRSFGVNINLTF